MSEKSCDLPMREKSFLDPEDPSPEQKRCHDAIIEVLRRAPWKYVPLRKFVDRRNLTQDQANEILWFWEQRIKQWEKEFWLENPEEDNDLKKYRVGVVKEVYRCRYPDTYRVKPLGEQIDILNNVLQLYRGFSVNIFFDDATRDGQKFELLSRELNTTVKTRRGFKKIYHVDGIFYIPPIYLVAEIARARHPDQYTNMRDDHVALCYALRCLRRVLAERGLTYFNTFVEHDHYKNSRLHPRAAHAHAKNELLSQYGITLWPIQTGKTRIETPHATLNSLRNGDQYVLKEVPLDVYSIACLLISHPERMDLKGCQNQYLSISAIGSQKSPFGTEGPYVCIPDYNWAYNRLSLGWHNVYGTYRQGNATAFL